MSGEYIISYSDAEISFGNGLIEEAGKEH